MNHATEWLTSTQIAKRLRISRNSLYALRKQKILKPGDHFISQGRRAVFDVAATELALRDHTSQMNSFAENDQSLVL
jgi:hypothetical protein